MTKHKTSPSKVTRKPSLNVAVNRMTADRLPEAFSLACEQFTEASVLHAATRVSLSEYKTYLYGTFEHMQKQGLSLIATHHQTNELIGCLVACDYTLQNQSAHATPDSLKPIQALLDRLDELYRAKRQINPGEIMLVDMAVVKPEAAGHGVYRTMREAVHRIGHDAGFNRVVGELSSAATQHLCINRFGHQVCAEIDYATFDYEGQRPFASIKEPSSIVLVEGHL